jgi:sialic acid synthase
MKNDNYKKPFLIAEIGCNHKGDMEIAKELVKIAKIFCNADAVKFQKRNNRELLTEEQYNAPHPNPANSYGDTYGAHREYLEFDLEQNRELKEYCEEMGIVYSTSVWDLTSAKEVASLNPEFIKIPSACNNNFEMLDWLCKNYKGEIHISTGMTTKDETEDLVNFFIERGRNKDLVLYNCTSGYPVPFEDVCLLDINILKDKYADKVKHIGFSGHHLGIAVDIAAYTLGAHIIERHYTIDRTWKGTDHAASLEPMGLRKLSRDLAAVHQALTYKKKDILDIEQVQRDKLKNQKV